MNLYKLMALSICIGVISVWMGELSNNYPLQALIIFVVILNISFLIYYFKNNFITSSFSDVVVLLVISYTVYFITYPIDQAMSYVQKYSDEDILRTSVFYIVSNVMLLVGIYFGNKIGKKTKLNSGFKELEFNLNFSSIVILVLGIVLMFYDQYRLGGFDVIGITNRLDNFAAQRLTSSSSVALPWHNFIEAGFIGLALSIKRKKDVRMLLLLMLLLSTFFFLGLGSRTMILLTCLPAIAILIDKKIIILNKIQNSIIILLIIVLISPFFTNYRNYLISDISFSDLPQSAWAWSNGETGTSFQISVDVTKAVTWGDADATYVTSFLYLLPSVVYETLRSETKPLNLGDWYVMHYYPLFYSSGGGFGFSPVAQAWMNGGILSLIIVFFMIGAIFSYINRTSYFKYLLLALVIWLQRGAFNSVISEFVYTAVLLIAIIMSSRLLENLKQKNRNFI